MAVKNASVSLLVFALIYGASAVSTAQTGPATYRVEGTRLIVSGPADVSSEVTLPCPGTRHIVANELIYVACSEGGIVTISIAEPHQPVVSEVSNLDVKVTEFALVGEEVWYQVEKRELAMFPLRDIATHTRRAPPAEPRPPAIAPVAKAPEPRPEVVEKPVGKVVATAPGFAIIDLGSDHGLDKGSSVEFFTHQKVDLGGEQAVSKEQRLTIGVVDTAGAARSKVELGLNEDVPMNASVRQSDLEPTYRSIVPQRVAQVWEASFIARPFLALGTVGGGAIIDAAVTYRFRSPWALDLVVSPFGFGIAEAGNLSTFAVNLLGSLDTTWFQIGLGGGVSKLARLSQGQDFVPAADGKPAIPLSLSIAQFARLGARDGLNVSVLMNFLLVDDAAGDPEFTFGGLLGSFQAPFSAFGQRGWLIARGGGGLPGHVVGEVGMRILLRGNGLAGSLFLTPTVGGESLTEEHYVEAGSTECPGYFPEPPNNGGPPGREPGFCRVRTSYGGPMIGFGMEWRF